MSGITRRDLYQATHVVGVGLIAGLSLLLNEPDPVTWRSVVKSLVAGLSAGGLYWAKPPGMVMAPRPVEPDTSEESQP